MLWSLTTQSHSQKMFTIVKPLWLEHLTYYYIARMLLNYHSIQYCPTVSIFLSPAQLPTPTQILLHTYLYFKQTLFQPSITWPKNNEPASLLPCTWAKWGAECYHLGLATFYTAFEHTRHRSKQRHMIQGKGEPHPRHIICTEVLCSGGFPLAFFGNRAHICLAIL